MKQHLKRFTGSSEYIYTLGIIFLFLLWLVVSISIEGGETLFPSPISTFKVTFELLGRSYIWTSIGWTMLRTLIGFVSSFIVAFILGSIAGNYQKVYLFLKPLITVFKSIPTAALVFLFLVLSGAKYAPIYIVFLLSFPILYEAVSGGIRSIDKEVIESARLDTNNFFHIIFNIKMPLSVPYILVGIASSFALSLKTEIMAEIITGDTKYGLGCAISAYRNMDPSDLTPIFGVALIALTIILLIDLLGYIVKKLLDK